MRPVTTTFVDGGAPLTVVDVWATVPMYGVTVYAEIGPPGFAGGCQLTYAAESPGVAVTLVGGPQIQGTTALDGADGGPVPAAFVAVTLNEYETPFESPRTVQVVVPEVEQVAPPGLAVAV